MNSESIINCKLCPRLLTSLDPSKAMENMYLTPIANIALFFQNVKERCVFFQKNKVFLVLSTMSMSIFLPMMRNARK